MRRQPAEVRQAVAADVDDVLALWTTARNELDRSGRQIASAAQIRPRLESGLASGDIEVLVARWDGAPAGFVMLRAAPLTLLHESPAMHLEQLYVTPDLRRHGIARALLNAVVARADRAGADQVVTSVMPWARETHRFFARLGFTPLVVRRGVTTAALRRRLAGESPRGALEDLLSRRRSLRARTRDLPGIEPAERLRARHPRARVRDEEVPATAPVPAAEEALPAAPGAPASVVVPEPVVVTDPVDVPRPA